MARPRMKDYEFSWKNIVSKDDSAFMCHYAHARLFKYFSNFLIIIVLNKMFYNSQKKSLLEKCKLESGMEAKFDGVNLELLDKNIELALIQHLARFEEVVWQSFQEYEPYHIVQYLFQLV